MKELFLETERLKLVKIEQNDFAELCVMLKDPEVMYAWEYGFCDDEVNDWINKNLEYYEKYNLGYFLALDKNENKVVGQIALMPDIIKGKRYVEVGYILKKEFWHKGYAYEGASALVEYAFDVLKEPRVIAEIRPCNTASQNVAKRLGMQVTGNFEKTVKDKPMLHLIYSIDNPHMPKLS